MVSRRLISRDAGLRGVAILLYLLRFGFLFFFNDPATTEIYTLSLHDALPIYFGVVGLAQQLGEALPLERLGFSPRSEEHMSELQSRQYLVCRLLLEKKKNKREMTLGE